MSRIKLYAGSISCQHCAKAIRRELGALESVRVVDVDAPTKIVTLEIADQDALAQAQALLAEIGYPAEPVAA